MGGELEENLEYWSQSTRVISLKFPPKYSVWSQFTNNFQYKQCIFQDIVDLWVMGIYFTDFIYNKSVLGFMGIYGKPVGHIKSP